MRPDRAARLAAFIVPALLVGCTLLPTPAPAPQPVAAEPRLDPSLAVVAEHLQLMARLNQGTPVEQAEILKAARDAAQIAPTTTNLLRLALVLATPEHGGSDPESARQRLSELLALPESLLPAERALAMVYLDHVDKRLVLQSENQKLQAANARSASERGAATNRRLQAEIEENNRLRRALKEAQDKLDEIARIERQVLERKPANGTR